MTIRKIARMGHPVLLTKAAPVADAAAVQDLIRDMHETLVDARRDRPGRAPGA